MSAALRVEQLIRAAVGAGTAPAIAFSVTQGDTPPRRWYAGHHRPASAPANDPGVDPGRRCGPETIWDLASLTKPLTTLPWALRLVEAGRLALDSPLGLLCALDDPALREAPLWRLLSHTSGLPAHREYFRGLGPPVLQTGRFDRAASTVRRMLAQTPVDAAPGAGEVYSDLGFLLLEMICAGVDRPLAEVWPTLPGHGSDPRGLHQRPLSTPAPAVDEACAATERCAWRKRLLQGEVHDDNAWTMGGVAGHAGTFGTLAAVEAMGRAWLDALADRPSALGIGSALARRCVDRRWMHPRGTRVLGWDTPTPGRSSAGRRFGPRAFGHLGFTGTSLWIDPDHEVVMVLLANRVSPSRANTAIRALRPALHDAGWATLESRFT